MSGEYDALIIGGGLAGLASAIQLGNKGYRIALFEKETYPFHKVCGEYISMESWDFLERMGINLLELKLPMIKKLKVTSPSGKEINSALDPGGFGISRFKLDNLMFELAKKAGATVFENTKVDAVSSNKSGFEIMAKDQTYKAKLVLGTWGKRSNLDIKLKRLFVESTKQSKNYVAVKYHINYPVDNDTIALHNFDGGYCGISNVEDGRTCLCYLTNHIALKKAGGNIKTMEEKVLMKNPFLYDIFSNATFLYDKPLAISQVSFLPKAPVENGIFMAGDTAGLITPLCGNGMSMALKASHILCNLAPQFFEGKINREELEKRYTREWKKEFKTRLSVGRLIQANFGKPFLTELFLKTLRPFPVLIKGLVKMTHGERF